MLDDLELIEKIDKSKMLDVVADFPNHIHRSLELTENIDIGEIDVDSIVISGMGGSAISGDIIKEWLRDKLDVPIFVNRDYSLPRWVGKNTLSIFLSYSGNTEETLSSFGYAIKRGCPSISISSGGKLEKISKEKGITHIKIPSGFQPRAATAYLLFPIIKILQKIGLIENSKLNAEIEETIDVSKNISDKNRKEVKISENVSKKVAKKIYDTLPHIYAWRYFVPIARRWKTQINENSEMIARFDEVPECNHNDVVGWRRSKISELSSCIFLRDKNEPVKIKERYSFMKEVFEAAGAKVIEIESEGNFLLTRMLSLMYIGDFVSCYLSILNKVDPTPVEIIGKLKERLAKI